MTWYIAGPMGYRAARNFPAFDKAAALLASKGIDYISPADMDREAEGFTDPSPDIYYPTPEKWSAYLRNDYAVISTKCDGIAFLPEWETSKGAVSERNFGLMLGLPFYRFDESITHVEPEIVIGVSGYARSGKDTAAQILTDQYGFERRAWADALKRVLDGVDPLIAPHLRLSDVRKSHAALSEAEFWDFIKATYPEVRPLWQRLGTEGGRKNISDDVWVRTVFERPHGLRLVIPDTRFDNEGEAIRKRHGIIIQVNRPGVGPANAHVSENVIEGDFVVNNDGTKEDLYEAIAAIAEKHIDSRSTYA